MSATATIPAAGLDLRRLSSEQWDEAKEIWGSIESTLAHVPLTCSWDWTSTWLTHYGDLIPHEFVVGTKGDEPRAIALVTHGVQQRRGPFRVATRHVGTAGEPPGASVCVNYNRVLADPADHRTFATALLDEMESWRGWDEIRLDGMPADEAAPFLEARPDARVTREICRYADLRALRRAHAEALPGLPGRRTLRRSMNRLGPIQTEWAASTGRALEILDELIDLHQRRWRARGLPGAFADDRFTAFHRDLVTRMHDQGRVVLFRASTESGTVGCAYSFADDRRLMAYQIGMAPIKIRRVSPGVTTDLLLMEEALERGFDEFDLLAGDAEYKRMLATEGRELLWVSVRPRGIRGAKWAAVDAAAAVRRRVRRVAEA